MTEVLGYERFAAHGGDLGAYVTNRLGDEFPEQVAGIHVTMVAEADLGPGAPPPSAAERVFLAERVAGQEAGGGYTHIQRTRPQTLAYGLADSPVGLAAWMLDKWREWSDCGGDPERRFTDMPRGGHFTAMEEPELLAQDLRGFFREVR